MESIRVEEGERETTALRSAAARNIKRKNTTENAGENDENKEEEQK
jgi:hypothetical protein